VEIKPTRPKANILTLSLLKLKTQTEFFL